jgi:hypothetical protein
METFETAPALPNAAPEWAVADAEQRANVSADIFGSEIILNTGDGARKKAALVTEFQEAVAPLLFPEIRLTARGHEIFVDINRRPDLFFKTIEFIAGERRIRAAERKPAGLARQPRDDRRANSNRDQRIRGRRRRTLDPEGRESASKTNRAAFDTKASGWRRRSSWRGMPTQMAIDRMLERSAAGSESPKVPMKRPKKSRKSETTAMPRAAHRWRARAAAWKILWAHAQMRPSAQRETSGQCGGEQGDSGSLDIGLAFWG